MAAFFVAMRIESPQEWPTNPGACAGELSSIVISDLLMMGDSRTAPALEYLLTSLVLHDDRCGVQMLGLSAHSIGEPL